MYRLFSFLPTNSSSPTLVTSHNVTWLHEESVFIPLSASPRTSEAWVIGVDRVWAEKYAAQSGMGSPICPLGNLCSISTSVPSLWKILLSFFLALSLVFPAEKESTDCLHKFICVHYNYNYWDNSFYPFASCLMWLILPPDQAFGSFSRLMHPCITRPRTAFSICSKFFSFVVMLLMKGIGFGTKGDIEYQTKMST